MRILTLALATLATITAIAQNRPACPVADRRCCEKDKNACGVFDSHAVSYYDAALHGNITR